MPASPCVDSRRFWKGIWPGLALAGVLTQAACYTYVAPSSAELTPGTRLDVALTDRGRADLADQIGSGVLRLEGRLLSNSPQEYVLGVTRVRAIDGTSSRWAGERLSISRDHVATVRERRLSRSRTTIAAATAVVVVAAFIASRSLSIFGFEADDDDTRNPSPSQ